MTQQSFDFDLPEFLNVTEWRRRGYKPRPGEQPRQRRQLWGRVMVIFDSTQVTPIRRRKVTSA